ncbi:ribosome quality control complex subunit 1 [Podospora aff. communis PSN243]|uniref:Ribosome quality control complex subunit 1 n=1 Tax=Podospora aff. communis PSN243 TaxID=3040156 RepID=A0AAV9GZB1_9PEZI|nr:ribosome quality control complex subunit 1 [Podospora aff. communis PSN243]
MASRQLRKLRQQQDALISKKGVEEKHEDSEDDEPVVHQRKNAFSAFAALGDNGDDDDEDQKSSQDEANPEISQQVGVTGRADEAPPSKKGRKSKRKKKKGKQPLDDIDQALKELNLDKPKNSSSKPADPAAAIKDHDCRDLFKINFHHLKTMNEMRRLFGKTVEAVEAENSAQANRPFAANQEVNLETYLSGTMVGPPGRAPKSGMFDTILRTNPFIEGKKTWPKGSALGLKMTVVPQEDLTVEYTFSHDRQYDQLESRFFSVVQMGDPMELVHFLQRNPYHISSLIQVSKYAKIQDQNPVLAADLIERALFSFGRVSLKAFRAGLEKGQVYMNHLRPENRQFFLAGWYLIQHLISKGTVRTALEWSKLFLSINEEDPYAMINWIHVLAIRAHEAQWFIDLCQSHFVTNGYYFLTRPYFEQTLVLAHLQLGSTDSAKAALIRGIQSVPWLYCALFSALSLDPPKSIWGVQPRDDEEALHTKLYIHMTKDLWTAPQTISLLKEAANAAQKVDVKTLPKGPLVSLSTARFVYLDNNPELMTAVPRQMLHQSPNYEFDPLPPPKALNVFSSPTQEQQWDPPAPRGGQLPGFLRDPRVRAALRAQAQEEGRNRGGIAGALDDDDDGEEARRAEEALLAREAAATGDGAPMAGSRGFLAQVLDLMMGGGGGDVWGGDGDLPDMPGGWGDEDEWDDDDFEEEDDFGDEDDDDSLPDLEPVLPANPRHARVEDAEDEDEELPSARR